MDDEILAVAGASPVRRWMGIAMVAFVGGLSVYVALSSAPFLVWQVFLIGVGALALGLAEKMRRATELRLELTSRELRDSSGQVLARVDQIKAVDRGFMAFKPSNGFVIQTTEPGARRWRPGMWWRVGRRVGIGGVVPGHQTKAMSDILAAILAQRNE